MTAHKKGNGARDRVSMRDDITAEDRNFSRATVKIIAFFDVRALMS